MPPQLPTVDRVLLIVMDGLRVDAMPLFGMPSLERLCARGAWTFAATTVQPSVTAAAMGSLLTGVAPAHHGLSSDRFTIPRPRCTLDPLPRVLARAGMPTHAYLASIPRAYRAVASGLARLAGVQHGEFHGEGARDVLTLALPALTARDRGLFLLHWPDADRAGHVAGWTSREYVVAVRALDGALGTLLDATDPFDDPSTLVVVLADHGGGGTQATNHDSQHPMDTRIPLVFAGGAVRPGELGAATLLDVPATVAQVLGARIPAGWGGRVIAEAFQQTWPPEHAAAAVPGHAWADPIAA